MSYQIDMREKEITDESVREAIEEANWKDIPQDTMIIVARESQRKDFQKCDHFIPHMMWGVPIKYETQA